MRKSNQKNEYKYLNRCRYCMEDLHTKVELIDYLSKKTILCGKCRNQMQPLFQMFYIKEMNVFAFYQYNRFLEGMLFQYKEGRDSALANVFFYDIKTYIEKKYRNYTIVLMPSSTQKNNERGFYALAEMTHQIKLPKISPFVKVSNRKQSRQRIEEREKIKDNMILNPNVLLPKGPLLLLDDVMTTGSTMKSAYTLLAHHEYPLKICVLALHELLLENKIKKQKFNIHF